MRNYLYCLVLIVTAAPLFADEPQGKPSTPAEAVIATMRAIRAASAAGDKDSWDKLVAPKCSFIEPGGVVEGRAAHVPKPAVPNRGVNTTSELSDITVHDSGDVAILTYREDQSVEIGGNATHAATRYTETYQRSGGKWSMIFSAETPIPLPKVIKVDPGIYGDYTGEYEIAPQMIGTVYRQGGQLMLIGTGWKRPYELLPVATDTFVVKGMEQNEITFVRDNKGKVTHQSSKYRGQQQVMAKKIK